MIRVREAIVVEGRYDANMLRQLVDAPILETSGFGIFNNREQLNLLRKAAESRGLIILTDSDGAGFVIRRYLSGAIDPKLVKHAYVPDVYGKERRKSAPSKEGKLGVEGMEPSVLLDALRRAGATIEGESAQREPSGITKQDFYRCGLSGGAGSKERRAALIRSLELPEHLSANALLTAVNLLMTRTEFMERFGQPSNIDENGSIS